ncbi:MAG TPA: carboxypeptidase-like regulatory domain-containing protein [Luteibaculaceae bacterium]|nr:carboxypeptidase-like regulatory domain-containing protein [Luteibaculaceae bacterium]
MKHLLRQYISVCLLIFGPVIVTFAQNRLTGVVRDKVTNESLIGATVTLKGTKVGAITDLDGKWDLRFAEEFPVTVVITYLGYKEVSFQAKTNNESFSIRLEPEEKAIAEVKVIGERVAQKIKESPVTIERLGIQEIKQTAAVGFYEGLSSLKGVDMTSASLGFKIINTRGFNSTSPVRTLQIIDGVDNQAPGLNFSLGNFVGASELDVERVDIVVGANSATYGPNAFNGVIDIQTKDPYKYQGVDLMIKGAERNLIDVSGRVAFVADKIETDSIRFGLFRGLARFNNRYLKDRLAFKVNASYFQAYDWTAEDYGTTASSFNPRDVSPGWDGVNIYGESQFPTLTRKFTPFELGITQNDVLPSYFRTETIEGEQVPVLYVYRTGYREIDLADYNTYSLKLQGLLSYKLPRNIGTLSYQYNYGNGTTIYQGDNRYSVKDIKFLQQRVELKGERFFLRAYETREDAGKSYDLVFTAYQLLEGQKAFGDWMADFQDGFRMARRDMGISDIDAAIRYARTYADSPGNPARNNGAYLVPGSPEFKEAFNRITSNPSFQGGGTRFADQSFMRHIQGEYDFDMRGTSACLPEKFKIGGNYRLFNPNSSGTIFSDTLIDRNNLNSGFVDIKTWEFGVFATLEKALSQRTKVIASLRFDDHVNFRPFYTPALSLIVNTRPTGTLRTTFTTAYRNPTLQDQFLFYNIGVARLRGNLNGFNLILPEDYFGNDGYLANSQDNYRPIFVEAVRPERVRTIEIGYKDIAFKNIYVDASAYYSVYNDFLGFIVGFIDNSKQGQRDVEAFPTRIAANAKTLVTTFGSSIGLNYYFPKYFNIGANYTYSELLKRDNNDPLIPFFNTPRHKANFNFGGRDIRNTGFNIAYKIVSGFDYFGSPQFTGPVPTYGLVDVQVNRTFPKFGVTAKVGASNVLNNLHIEAYGAPLIGRLIYASVNYQFSKAKQ